MSTGFRSPAFPIIPQRLSYGSPGCRSPAFPIIPQRLSYGSLSVECLSVVVLRPHSGSFSGNIVDGNQRERFCSFQQNCQNSETVGTSKLPEQRKQWGRFFLLHRVKPKDPSPAVSADDASGPHKKTPVYHRKRFLLVPRILNPKS